MSYLRMLEFTAAVIGLVGGGAWGFQVILFLNRRGPYDYGWKGIVGGLAWLTVILATMFWAIDKIPL